ncbi:MAG: hypothetical protein KME27_09020 [Lyngbya sp. HA4199-MV5]|jgi:hypothetical protein|nr:hypothetical protein [Lyngbya sp. HA4199-MV5]
MNFWLAFGLLVFNAGSDGSDQGSFYRAPRLSLELYDEAALFSGGKIGSGKKTITVEAIDAIAMV